MLVAAPFHDIGIWTDQTFDYLGPSVARALDYLAAHGRCHLAEEVALLIEQHHKILPYAGPFADTVERYRKADLVDVSFGWVRHGLPRGFVRSVKAAYPDLGFHRRLAELAISRARQRPSSPLPMLRW